MVTEDSLRQILIDIDFAKRYYACYEKFRRRQGSEGVDPAVIAAVLEPLGFKYHKKDRFYRHAEKRGDREVELHVAFAKGTVELILGIEADGASLGGPFAGLAIDIARRADPGFSYTPAFPKLPYSSREELREAIDFGLRIFNEVKERLFGVEESSAR